MWLLCLCVWVLGGGAGPRHVCEIHAASRHVRHAHWCVTTLRRDARCECTCCKGNTLYFHEGAYVCVCVRECVWGLRAMQNMDVPLDVQIDHGDIADTDAQCIVLPTYCSTFTADRDRIQKDLSERYKHDNCFNEFLWNEDEVPMWDHLSVGEVGYVEVNRDIAANDRHYVKHVIFVCLPHGEESMTEEEGLAVCKAAFLTGVCVCTCVRVCMCV